MKTGKSLKEAIFRSQQSTENNVQSQDQLYAMKTPQTNYSEQLNSGQAPLNESHSNLMQSWLNLRGMEYELENKLNSSSKNYKANRSRK